MYRPSASENTPTRNYNLRSVEEGEGLVSRLIVWCCDVKYIIIIIDNRWPICLCLANYYEVFVGGDDVR